MMKPDTGVTWEVKQPNPLGFQILVNNQEKISPNTVMIRKPDGKRDFNAPPPFEAIGGAVYADPKNGIVFPPHLARDPQMVDGVINKLRAWSDVAKKAENARKTSELARIQAYLKDCTKNKVTPDPEKTKFDETAVKVKPWIITGIEGDDGFRSQVLAAAKFRGVAVEFSDPNPANHVSASLIAATRTAQLRAGEGVFHRTPAPPRP